MKSESHTKDEYRAASQRLIAEKRLPEDEWLMEELLAALHEKLPDHQILEPLRQKGGDAFPRLLKLVREEYWRRRFATASQEDQAGITGSAAIEECRDHTRQLATEESSWRQLRDDLASKNCSLTLAEKLCDDPGVLAILQENVDTRLFSSIMGMFSVTVGLALGYFTGFIMKKLIFVAPILIPIFLFWIFFGMQRRKFLRKRIAAAAAVAKSPAEPPLA